MARWIKAEYIEDAGSDAQTVTPIWFRRDELLLVIADELVGPTNYTVYFAGISDEAFTIPRKYIDPILDPIQYDPPSD